MRSILFIFIVAFLVGTTSCKKEEESDSTQTVPSAGTDTFSVDFEDKKEPFVGLITRYTCGACGQYGHPNLDQLLADHENINGAAFKYLPADPLHTEESIAVFTTYPVQGTPTFFLGAAGYGSDINQWKSDALSDTNTHALVKIAIIGKRASSNLFNLEVKLLMDPSLENKSLSLSLYALENNIISGQTDYSRNPTFVDDYVHNHVLRKAFGASAFGDSLNYSTDTTTVEYQFEAPGEINADYIYFTALVWELDSNREPIDMLNSQSVNN